MPVRAGVVLLGLGVAACNSRSPVTEGEPGAPLPGLREDELETFAAGEALFNRPFTPEEGLGPLFNQDRCSSCHDLPTSGGHGAEPVAKASRFDSAQGCNVLTDQGGDLLQFAVTDHARALGVTPERMPPDATAATDMRAPALYGLGLVEAIPDDAILQAADPGDADGDGISGRPNLDAQGRLGRFGRKAQHATLFGFVEEAARLEMGLTTPDRPLEESANGVPVPLAADLAPDPEIGQAELQILTDYVRFLAPPRPVRTDNVDPSDVREGAKVFEWLGCESCHTPTFQTTRSEAPAFDRKTFRLYSDLLLHDLGPDLAETCTPGTTPSEWKTARLVGLGHRFEFLHNGRAQTIEEAILLHGGEASAMRDTFRRLNPSAKRQLLNFLMSL